MSTHVGPCTAFILCDSVITDRDSGKPTIVGIFSRLYCSSFPTQHGMLGLYARLADLEGYHTFKVEVRDSEDQFIAKVGPAEARTKRIAPFEVILHAQGLIFKRPGKHEFQFFVDGELAATTTLFVELLQPKISVPEDEDES